MEPKSQLIHFMAAAADRAFRDACMKTAIRLSRLLKRLGAKRTAAGLLEAAYRRFPVGARGDYGEKDLHIFGRRPDALIAEFAAYLKEKGRDHGRAPEHQPAQDIARAKDLMHAHGIFDPLSLFVVNSPVWGSLLTLLIVWQALFFALRGRFEPARVTAMVFLCACIAVALFWRLRERFLAWMTAALFYAAARRLENEQRHGQKPTDAIKGTL